MRIETNEIWKSVAGYEGLYEISNVGRVRSLDRMVKAKVWYLIKGIILKPIMSAEYPRVNLCNRSNGVRSKYFLIHRLVAIAFILNPENKREVNYKDGIKTNNFADNLEWVTSSENQKHAFAIGLSVGNKGSANPRSVLKERQVLQIKKLLLKNVRNPIIARKFGVSDSAISAIKNKTHWSWLC